MHQLFLLRRGGRRCCDGRRNQLFIMLLRLPVVRVPVPPDRMRLRVPGQRLVRVRLPHRSHPRVRLPPDGAHPPDLPRSLVHIHLGAHPHRRAGLIPRRGRNHNRVVRPFGGHHVPSRVRGTEGAVGAVGGRGDLQPLQAQLGLAVPDGAQAASRVPHSDDLGLLLEDRRAVLLRARRARWRHRPPRYPHAAPRRHGGGRHIHPGAPPAGPAGARRHHQD
mmetsp:Transcript_7987/g.19438  ORF Transcript_7987/g.19438 Transcript_7987/m.19438 type:complete len:220 (-) Transcript_7987:2577-3236(-)